VKAEAEPVAGIGPLMEVIEQLEATGWAALVVDAGNRLVWISDELQGFIGERDPEKLGIGRHFAAALMGDTWLRTITPDSAIQLLTKAMPFLVDTVPGGVEAFADTLTEPMRSAMRTIHATPMPELWTGYFEYQEGEFDPYQVRFVFAQLRDRAGQVVGGYAITYIGTRPTLVSLLARGDATMYERMARLVDPGRHQAAILFADLQDSGELSRRLPTARYFNFIRSLTTRFDRTVAEHCGIIGKHAGDGMTAFFLIEDSHGAAAAVANALRTARQVQHTAGSLGSELGDVIGDGIQVNIGLHWGANLFMGQLVPGGRLDVTALGDEVNECARLQESMRGGGLGASKAFLELLGEDDARALQVDVAEATYRPLASLEGVSPKAVRDAGTMAVARL
jgi:class 3 adenylate cyclase